ncbi:hypothetical protein FRC00_006808 [Tulasnella sp. 408]|nr:hypothetical protein FRC00_006808 [Tulasnella sp. 408]
MSSWATFTSSFTSSLSPSFPLSSPPTTASTYNAYHQEDRPRSLPQRLYPHAGEQGPRLQQQTLAFDYDYLQLQKLVQLRESKLADCSYLTRQKSQRKKASVSERPPAQLKPASPVNPVSGHVLQPGKIIGQLEYNVAKAPTGPEEASGFTFQGEGPARFSTPGALQGFTSSWGKQFTTETLGGNQFGQNGGFSPFQFSPVSPAGYSSDESTTDSESELLSFRADFTWSFPISREERRGGVKHSAYSFDEEGNLRGLEKSPVAIFLTPPSEPVPMWRPSPNDPTCRPRRKDLLHAKWSAKH